MFPTLLTPTVSMLPHRWEQQIHSKSWNLSTRLHAVTSEKIISLIFTANVVQGWCWQQNAWPTLRVWSLLPVRTRPPSESSTVIGCWWALVVFSWMQRRSSSLSSWFTMASQSTIDPVLPLRIWATNQADCMWINPLSQPDANNSLKVYLNKYRYLKKIWSCNFICFTGLHMHLLQTQIYHWGTNYAANIAVLNWKLLFI